MRKKRIILYLINKNNGIVNLCYIKKLKTNYKWYLISLVYNSL